jgi:hypothetical protein
MHKALGSPKTPPHTGTYIHISKGGVKSSEKLTDEAKETKKG